jgi:hypothetical protein
MSPSHKNWCYAFVPRLSSCSKIAISHVALYQKLQKDTDGFHVSSWY